MDFLTYLAKEWSVIGQAPLTFIVAAVLAGLVAFALVKWAYATRLEHAQSTISMLEKRLDRAEQSDAIAIAATAQATKRYDADAVRKMSAPRLANAPSGPREFLLPEHTPETLMASISGQTQLQAQKSVEHHVGKWMTVTGDVLNVVGEAAGPAMVALPIETGGLLFCSFDKSEDAENLAIGDRTRIIGQLASVNGFGVSLQHCEQAS